MAELHSAPFLTSRWMWAWGVSLYAAALSAGVAIIIFWEVYLILDFLADVGKRSMGYFELLARYQLPVAVLMAVMSSVALFRNSERALDRAVFASVLVCFACWLALILAEGINRIVIADVLVSLGATLLPSIAMAIVHRDVVSRVCRRFEIQSNIDALVPDSLVEVGAIACLASCLLWPSFGVLPSAIIGAFLFGGLLLFLLVRRLALCGDKK